MFVGREMILMTVNIKSKKKISDHLADSCKRLNFNQVLGTVMDFLLFSSTFQTQSKHLKSLYSIQVLSLPDTSILIL